jgi:oligopeptide transport system ATP-binding protein
VSGPIVSVNDLVQTFLGRDGRTVRAVDGISFDIERGETFTLVGESGCGKTTTAELVLMLQEPASGSVRFDGQNIGRRNEATLKQMRRRMQVVFQNPRSSLNPRMRIREILSEPFWIQGAPGSDIRAKVDALLQLVRLEPHLASRYPHEVSGGQAQRIAVARALALGPELVVLDEPTSALDVSVQAQIINLLKDLQKRLALTYLFISHDLRIVRHLSTRVAIMYLGKIVEHGATEAIFATPKHPYTQALLSAVPRAHPRIPGRRIVLGGDIPSPSAIPSGCRFRTRCFAAQPICTQIEPPLRTIDADRSAACHFA